MNNRVVVLVCAVVLLSGCGAGALERRQAGPLSHSTFSDSSPNIGASSYGSGASSSRRSYERASVGGLSRISFGVVVDKTLVDINGTSDTGSRIGGVVGAMNAMNHNSASTESWVFRMVAGAVIGAVVENTLTSGQGYEYIIKRTDGQLVSTISEAAIGVGQCLLMRGGDGGSAVRLELKQGSVCQTVGKY